MGIYRRENIKLNGTYNVASHQTALHQETFVPEADNFPYIFGAVPVPTVNRYDYYYFTLFLLIIYFVKKYDYIKDLLRSYIPWLRR